MGGRFSHLALGGGMALTVSLVGGLASPAQAQALTDKYFVELGAYWPDVDTKVRVDNKNTSAPGTTLDLEQDLALKDRETLWSIFGGVRLSKRWSLIGEYYALDRDAGATTSRTINFDDVTYDAGTTISTSFNTDIYRLAVGYAFYRTDQAEIGASLGAHITNFQVELNGSGHVGGAAASSQARKRDALAPLPTIGLYGGYAFTPKFHVTGRFDWLSLKVGDYDGRLTNTEVAASYRFTDNIGAGVMYRYVDYNLDVDKSNWTGAAAYTYKGPAVFVQVGF